MEIKKLQVQNLFDFLKRLFSKTKDLQQKDNAHRYRNS